MSTKRSLQRQGGIRVVSNVPADAKITMHVRQVPLLHALEVLAANAGASWSVAYVSTPNKGAIETALGALAGRHGSRGMETLGDAAGARKV